MDFQKLKQILPKDPLIWSQDDVQRWLEFIGLEKYSSQFQQMILRILKHLLINYIKQQIEEYTIDGSCLCTLNEDELKNDLQIQNSIQRKKLLNWISLGIKQYSQFLKQNEDVKANQIVLSELNSNSQQFLLQDKNKVNNFQKKPKSFEETNVSNRLSFQNVAQEDKYLFEMHTNNIKQTFGDQFSGNNYKMHNQENYRLRLPVCNGQLDSSTEEDKENIEDFNQQEQIIEEQVLGNIINPIEEIKNMLIIEPVEGIQTNFFCVKEEGGKIGRHSSNQILILEESISRLHAEIVYHDKKFFLKDIGSSTGTFIKIQDRFLVQLGMLFEMGSYQFEVTHLDYQKKQIQLTFIDDAKPSSPKKYNVNSQNTLENQLKNISKYKQLEIKSNGEQAEYVSIGRKPTNKIQLPDDQHLSNIHAKIYFMNGQFFLEDNASTNGSWIRLSKEGQKSGEFEIQNNTIIKIGSTSSYNCRLDHAVVKEPIVSDACFICFSEDKDAVFLPCRHNTSCIKCSKTLQICPICRTKIEDTVKIFKA